MFLGMLFWESNPTPQTLQPTPKTQFKTPNRQTPSIQEPTNPNSQFFFKVTKNPNISTIMHDSTLKFIGFFFNVLIKDMHYISKLA